MADPAIQTFCCVRLAKKTNPAFYAMMEFNSTPYNFICLLSSLIGIVGASYQIRPNTNLTHKHRSVTLVCLRGRKIIVWLAVADLLATVGVFVRSIVNLNDLIVEKMWDNNVGLFFCTFISAWIQYWYCVTWLWTLCYTFDVALALQDRNANYLFYHAFCWTVPAVLTGIGLFYLYYPEGSCVDVGASDEVFIHVLPNYIVTYLPMISVMIINPLLYCYAGKYVHRMVWHGLGQFTNKEREIVDSTYLTFILVNFVFYVCWLPNLFSTLIVWTLWHRLTQRLVLILWYIMAVVNPMQALFNCLVYNHFSSKMNVPWAPAPPEVSDETTPLLGQNRRESNSSTPM